MKTFKFPKSDNKVEICIFCIFLPLCYLLTLLKAGTMLGWFFIFLQCESKTFTKKTFLRRWTEKNWTQLSLEGYRRYHHSCDDNLFQISHQFFNTFTIIITTAIINKIVILFFIIIITRPKPAYGWQGLAGGSLEASGAQLGSGKWWFFVTDKHTHTLFHSSSSSASLSSNSFSSSSLHSSSSSSSSWSLAADVS